MLFPSEALEQSRRALAEKLESAALEPADAFEQMLAIDSEDRIALFELSRLRQEAGDLAAAERYCRRGLDLHPCDYRFYVQLSGLLAAQDRDLPIAAALMELGVRKLLCDAGGLDDAERLRQMGKFPSATVRFDDPEALDEFAASLLKLRDAEPPEVTAELECLRLLHDLQEALGNELERELVEAIVARGPACTPLLLGVLRGVAQQYLPESGPLMAEAALALLGEIGDPEALPALVNFAMVDDKGLSDIATWALLRAATQRPGDMIAAIRDFYRELGAGERACMAEVLASMPPAPGKAEALAALLENFEAVPEDERTDAFVMISVARLSALGKPAVPAIRASLAEMGKVLPRETTSEVNDLLRAYAADPASFAVPPEEGVPTLYDICCADRIQEYEEDAEEADGEEEEEHVHGPGCSHDHEHDHVDQRIRKPAPGRNDECWCGSGKKYKKCHLAADEAEQR